MTNILTIRNLLLISPIFLLTVKHWINLIVIFMFINSLVYLYSNKNSLKVNFHSSFLKLQLIISFSLLGPFLAVAISQILRNELYFPNYDAPLRLALCIPIFLAVSNGWLSNINKEPILFIWMKYSFPSLLFFTFLFKPSWTSMRSINDVWGRDRITTYFVDALSFGSLTLLIGLISIATLIIFWNNTKLYVKIYLMLSATIGFYFSIMSGSRTGWLSIPIILIFTLNNFMIKIFGKIKSFLIVSLFIISIILLAHLQPILINKFYLIFEEILNYRWNDVNPDNSVGMRISFYRMALFYFSNNPINGWGDVGWIKLINSPEIAYYTTELTREYARNGFHNEIITSSIRSGVWGLVSSINLFLIPILVTLKLRKYDFNYQIKIMRFFVLIFVIHLFIAGITTEVTNLVFLASFIGFTISVTIGELLNKSYYLNKRNEDKICI